MADDRWNRSIVLHPGDRLFAATVGLIVPKSVRPNHLTLLRLLLIPFVLYFLSRERYAIGVPLFLFAALTDWFDGALARTRKEVTEWGIVHDPLVDKLLIGTVLFVIVLDHINFYLGMALLGVEAFMIAVGWYRKSRGAVEPANVWGKIKMVAEVCGVMLLLLALWLRINLLVDLSTGTLALALVFAIVSILSRIM
ncbi:MAG TPA: CDP-alcohol phosphatidyltransferase family protein [Candidatus Binatia bacterium]|jgi:CDP-diacylglycerol--glycerol-3-phosphate 3-phosphatidyltransferase|nr:CDP-alcohol phosphatidyltransferase family protein [Candidatus Binatia bacterium]